VYPPTLMNAPTVLAAGFRRLADLVAPDPLPAAAASAAKVSIFTVPNLLVWAHVGANLVWIGSAIAMGLLLSAKEGDPKVRGALARRIYTSAAMPAFIVSFLAGGIRTAMDLKYYFVQHHWMHGKLLFALIVIAIHHILGARARKMAAGSMQEAGPSGMLTIVLAVSAILAAFFVVLRFPN
jgi:putative membrane protein